MRPFRPWTGAALLVAAAACGDAPTAPRTHSIPLPVASAATPPIIRSVTVPTGRQEAGVDIPIPAVVDGTNQFSSVTYSWSASAGTMTGNGPTATFRLTPGIQKGVDVTVTLTVVATSKPGTEETTGEFRVTAQSAPFRVHDSVAELKELSRHFLIDLFGHSEVPPDACLVDFSDNGPCKEGKADELSDLINHRRDYVVLDRRMNSQVVTFTGTNTARVDNNAWFKDRRTDTGFEGETEGNFPLTAVYETRRWWLCTSGFDDDLRGDGGLATILRKRHGKAPIIKK